MRELTVPRIETARLLLRPFELSDAGDVRRLAGEFAVADTTLAIPHPYPEGAAEAWIAEHAEEAETGRNFTFAVTRGGELVGCVGLMVWPEHRRGEVGYWVGLPFWGQGIATEATRAVVDWGFGALGLNRVVGRHLTRNPASRRVMLRCGMVDEGVLREHLVLRGKPEDVGCLGILAREWSPRV